MRIVYVGTKEIKADNVTATPTSPGTGLIWTPGQIHEVADEKKAQKLLEYPIWRDADKPYEVMSQPKIVPAEPRVQFIPDGEVSIFWEPYVVVVPAEVLKKLQSKELVSVFMTSADADAFTEWKLERDTRPDVDTSPKNTGPKAQPKATKAGLDTKAGIESKRAAA